MTSLPFFFSFCKNPSMNCGFGMRGASRRSPLYPAAIRSSSCCFGSNVSSSAIAVLTNAPVRVRRGRTASVDATAGFGVADNDAGCTGVTTAHEGDDEAAAVVATLGTVAVVVADSLLVVGGSGDALSKASDDFENDAVGVAGLSDAAFCSLCSNLRADSCALRSASRAVFFLSLSVDDAE